MALLRSAQPLTSTHWALSCLAMVCAAHLVRSLAITGAQSARPTKCTALDIDTLDPLMFGHDVCSSEQPPSRSFLDSARPGQAHGLPHTRPSIVLGLPLVHDLPRARLALLMRLDTL